MAARGSAKQVDDLDSINAFLARIREGPVITTQHSPSASVTQDFRTPNASAKGDSEASNHADPDQLGQEDEVSALVTLANHSDQNLINSMHASHRPDEGRLNSTRAALATKNPNTPSTKRQQMPEAQKELVKRMKNNAFEESVLNSFKKKAMTLDKSMASAAPENDVAAKFPKVEGNADSSEDECTNQCLEAAPVPLLEENSVSPATPIIPDHSGHGDKQLLAEEAVQNGAVEKVEEPIVSGATNTPVVSTTPKKCSEEDEPESREHLTYFKTWGSAGSRNTLKARPRKVILTGLPPNTDHTFVTSLLHGGAIEAFKVLSSDAGIVKNATVLFVEADAAQNYYNTYPNGLEFKHQGKKCVVFVEMGKDIDVLSSLVRGQLEAGASRIVRATGADEDWGMRALCKLAEGKSRKLEGIHDSWRDEIRTIVFRFTNISDAVQFRGQIMRDLEWKTCNIQFMDDPCTTATGIHFEA